VRIENIHPSKRAAQHTGDLDAACLRLDSVGTVAKPASLSAGAV
jgi:hypothetical protein